MRPYKRIFIPFILSFIFLGCQSGSIGSLRPSYNPGGYSLQLVHNESDKTTISGKVIDVKTKLPIEGALIKLGCLKSLSQAKTGEYFFQEKLAVGRLFFTCSAIGYRSVETEQTEVKKGNIVTIVFYLSQDDKPFINCEGNP